MKNMRIAMIAALALLSGVIGGTQLAPGQQPAQTTFPEQKPKSDADASANRAANGAEPDEGEEWFTQQRAYPFEHIPRGARSAALRQHLAMKESGTHSLLALRR
jgi:hypothetical protein